MFTTCRGDWPEDVSKLKALRLIDITIVTGALLGLGSIILSAYGNPINSGICISCFMENVAGAMQLHDNVRMAYLRPEIMGFVIGSFFMAIYGRRFRVKGGSSPMVRFMLGFFIIIGCAVFIGCPIKMILRLAAGDLTAIAATAGMLFGIWIGSKYIRGGFRLDPERDLPKFNGYLFPILSLLFLSFVFFEPSFIKQGESGPAAAHAPVVIAIGLSLIIGAFAQKSGLCITGGFRNFFLFREKTLMNGILTTVGTAFVANLFLGQFNLGMHGQPASHEDHLWTFLALTLVGLASVLIDGCPFRQLIKAGQGDIDAGITSLGMLVGSALAISWSLGGSSAGTTFQGRLTVLLGFIFTLMVIYFYRVRKAK